MEYQTTQIADDRSKYTQEGALLVISQIGVAATTKGQNLAAFPTTDGDYGIDVHDANGWVGFVVTAPVTAKTLLVRDARNGQFPKNIVYLEKPFVIIGKENCIAWAGDVAEFNASTPIRTGYYDDCVIEARTNDLYLSDNTKLEDVPPPADIDDLTQSVIDERNAAQVKALKSLAGYKFYMFGYWAAAWVKYNSLLPAPHKAGSPFKFLVEAAREKVEADNAQ